MPLGADDVQSAFVDDRVVTLLPMFSGRCPGVLADIAQFGQFGLQVAAQHDVGSSAGHVGGDGHGAGTSGLGDDLGLLLVVLGVQYPVADFLIAKQVRQEFRSLDGGGADEDRLTAIVTILDVLDDRVELVAPGEVDKVRGIVANHFHVGRDHDHFQAVDLLKLVGFGIRGTGHSRELVVETEIVLEGDRSDGLVFFLDSHPFLGLDRLVQAVRPAPARHGSPGEFVDDYDFAVIDDVLHFLVEQGVRAQRGVQVVHEPDIARVIKALALVEYADPDQQRLDAFMPLLREMGLL